MVKVYIDGQEGTTGLKILERFKNRSDIELLRIDEDKRKDIEERVREERHARRGGDEQRERDERRLAALFLRQRYRHGATEDGLR